MITITLDKNQAYELEKLLDNYRGLALSRFESIIKHLENKKNLKDEDVKFLEIALHSIIENDINIREIVMKLEIARDKLSDKTIKPIGDK